MLVGVALAEKKAICEKRQPLLPVIELSIMDLVIVFHNMIKAFE